MSQVSGKSMAIAVTLVVVFVINFSTVKGDYQTAPYKYSCSTSTHENSDDYALNLGWTIMHVKQVTPTKPGLEFYTNGTYKDTTCYVLAKCTENRSANECFHCLDWATSHLFDSCGLSDGGQLLTIDCRVRYENYPFL